eukprot:scaffold53667_cov18-Tisochrysis_lutea.AAC.2
MSHVAVRTLTAHDAMGFGSQGCMERALGRFKPSSNAVIWALPLHCMRGVALCFVVMVAQVADNRAVAHNSSATLHRGSNYGVKARKQGGDSALLLLQTPYLTPLQDVSCLLPAIQAIGGTPALLNSSS